MKTTYHERLVQAEKVSFMAKDLTQQLLTFSRGGAIDVGAENITISEVQSVGYISLSLTKRCLETRRKRK